MPFLVYLKWMFCGRDLHFREHLAMGAEVFVVIRVWIGIEDAGGGALRGNGISVWVDEGNIHAADLWSEQIVQAIADCRVMVMLSQNSTDSHNVVKEVMLASEQKLLPVYLEPVDVPAKLQYQLAGIQHLELYGENEEQVLEDGQRRPSAASVGKVNQLPQSTTVKRHDSWPNLPPPPNRQLGQADDRRVGAERFRVVGLLFSVTFGKSVQSIDRDRGEEENACQNTDPGGVSHGQADGYAVWCAFSIIGNIS